MIIIEEIVVIDPLTPQIDVAALIQYFLYEYGNSNLIFTLPLTFPANSVSTTN